MNYSNGCFSALLPRPVGAEPGGGHFSIPSKYFLIIFRAVLTFIPGLFHN